MYLNPQPGNYLTEAADVNMEDRHFATTVCLAKASEAVKWREVTEDEKEKMLQQGTIFDASQLSPAYLDKVETLLTEIPVAMNETDAFADPATALKYADYYPEWGGLATKLGRTVKPGFRMRHNGKLWQVRQEHQLQGQWEPGAEGTEALYEEVVIDHAGTLDDPIPYDGNMELFNGKYYSQDGKTYLCNRSTGQPVYHTLAELVGLYVEVAEDAPGGEEETEEESNV